MAEKLALVEDFLTCHLCMEVFTDPVSLGCHHSFCSNCLQNFWDQAKHQNCPICERKCSKNSKGVNLALKELDSYSLKKADEAEDGCCKHTHDLQWFCKEEQRAVCHVCESPDLCGHTLVPIEQEVSELKEQLEPDFTLLQAKCTKFRELKKKYHDMSQHCKTQLVNTERQIRAEFDQLRRFLAEEEEIRVAVLREEEEQRRKAIAVEMKSIQTQICSLSASISAVERNLAQEDSKLFLASYKHTRACARAHCSPASDPPQLLPGGLVDVAKHLGNLSFRVWEKMKDRVKFTPVLLDPNTASCWLCLSDDLTSVRDIGEEMMVQPDNPERFMLYSNVLGCEGFSSGYHSWEVEVGDHPDWAIGVTKESADRKGPRQASPKYGVWCLWHRGERYKNGSGKSLPLKRVPQRIRIQLDYDRGEVSFYDPEDMTHICTHRDTFAEKVYPYFCVGPAGEAQSIGITVCDVCE